MTTTARHSRRGRRGTLIFLCVWHVKRAWLKNLQKKVSSYPVREQMLKELTEVLEARETDKARAGMDAFLKKWVRASSGATALSRSPTTNFRRLAIISSQYPSDRLPSQLAPV